MNRSRFSKRPTLNKGPEVGGKTEKVTVQDAPWESMTTRAQERLLDLFGQFDWDRDYDYKRDRSRG